MGNALTPLITSLPSRQIKQKVNVTCAIHQLPRDSSFSEEKKFTYLVQYSLVFPGGDENSHPACAKINDHSSSRCEKKAELLFAVIKRGGKPVPEACHLPPTPVKLSRTLTYRLWATARRLKQHLIWGDGNRGTHARNPVRVDSSAFEMGPSGGAVLPPGHW